MNEWLLFFATVCRQQVSVLETKIKAEEQLFEYPPLSQKLIAIAEEYGRLTVKDAVALTKANRNTIKKHITRLTQHGVFAQEGKGKGAWYRLQK